MKKQNKILGFTLIELLVVITIIGILATGATSVYTSQIQKARDTTRITDMNALKGGLEQAFQDIGMYPGSQATTSSLNPVCSAASLTTDSSVQCVVNMGFLNALPDDPKSGKMGNGSPLVYTYNADETNGVDNQVYEISMGVEAEGFRQSKATNTADGGNDANRVEFGVPGVDLNTCITGSTSCTGDSSTATYTAGDSCSIISTTAKATDMNVVLIKGACD